MANLEAVREEMIRDSEEFRQLHEQHQSLEARLESLGQQSMLSEADEIEIKRIKHEKLRLKDRMFTLALARETAAANV